MVKLRFFGGQNEIGGNKILLDDGQTRLFLDFGQSFGFEGRFFDYPYLSPSNICDLELISAIPEMNGLYVDGGLRPIYDDASFIGIEGKEEQKYIDGILISHAHLDHAGYLGLIHPDIPLKGSHITKDFLRLRREIFESWVQKYELDSFSGMSDGEVTTIGTAKITHYSVDHSIPGASAFIIEMGGLVICYSGDLRLHGRRPELTLNFIKEAANHEIDFFLCEGTRIESHPDLSTPEGEPESHSLFSEEQVEKKLTQILKGSKGLVVYDGSPADMDRMELVIDVAKRFGKEVVIDTKKAYLTEGINNCNDYYSNLKGFDGCHVLLSRKKVTSSRSENIRKRKKDESQEDYERYFALREAQLERPNMYIETYESGRMKYERAVIERFENLSPSLKLSKILWGPKGREEIKKNKNDILIYTSYGPNVLMQLGKGIEGTYIYGKAEPFNEEMEISFSKLVAWTELLGLDIEYAHTSGHANRADLKRIIDGIGPKFVLPIHTEKAQLFDEITKSAFFYKDGVELELTRSGPKVINS